MHVFIIVSYSQPDVHTAFDTFVHLTSPYQEPKIVTSCLMVFVAKTTDPCHNFIKYNVLGSIHICFGPLGASSSPATLLGIEIPQFTSQLEKRIFSTTYNQCVGYYRRFADAQ